MLSRVIVGARPALIVPIGVVLFAVLIGAPLGAIAGYKGGWMDEVIMRITDLFLAFPSLLLAMAIASALGAGWRMPPLPWSSPGGPGTPALVRGVTVSLKERYFVEAAQAIGVRDSVIILRHILPNTISPILVQATVDLGTVILAMGGLAFLGLGTQPPSPDWGLMVSEGRDLYSEPVVDLHLPRPGDFYRRAGLQPARRYLRDIFDPRQYR